MKQRTPQWGFQATERSALARWRGPAPTSSCGRTARNGKQAKAGYHHGGGALPFALESGSQSDNLILSFPHVVRFGLIAAYVRTWPVRTYAEKRESSDI